MNKDELINHKNRLLKIKEQKKIIDGNYHTGFATIDQPWMKYYQNNKLEEELNENKNMTVWDVTEKYLERYSQFPLIEYFNKTISREEFANYVEMWARTFRALGVEIGDYIPLYVPASPESYAMFLAANAIGAIPYYQKLAITKDALEEETKEAKIAVVYDIMWNNVSEVFKQDRFKRIIITSAADSLMFPLKQINKLKSYFYNRKNNINIPNTNKYIWTDKALQMSKYYTGNYKVPFSTNKIAIITTSSGTTSHNIKGAMDTNESIIHSLISFKNGNYGYRPGARTLTCFPPTASTSINCLQLSPTITGGTIIFDPRVDINLWYKQVIAYKPNITISTGSVWEQFIRDLEFQEKKGKKHDLSWADSLILGGSGTTPEILEHINDVMKKHNAPEPIHRGYGLSEVFGPICISKSNVEYDKDLPVTNVGIPLPGFKVGIFDEDGNELPYGKGYRGELRIKCNAIMHGYYGKKDITNKTIIDGWLHSGDLCEIDKNGNIYCYGRLKNTIKVSNQKVYLFDIANDIRKKYNLHDIFIENKTLEDENTALNIYFVQEEKNIIDSEKLIKSIDKYMESKNIKINGYKEFSIALPIDPTTIKPRNKDTEGFIKYEENEEYEVSYNEIKLDIYKENKIKKSEKLLTKVKK